MRALLFALVGVVVLALAVGGCSVPKSQRIHALFVEKGEAWKAAHPGEPMTPDVEASLKAEATAEVEAQIVAERKVQLNEAAVKGAEAAGHAASGNYIAAIAAGIPALLLLLGIGLPKNLPLGVKA